MSQIQQKTQDAFAAYLATVFTGLNVSSGLSNTEIIYPALLVVCENEPKEIAPATNIFEAQIHFAICSSLDDDGGTSAHESRCRQVYECLFDISQVNPFLQCQGVIVVLNQPATGPDNRTVQNFTCSGYVLTGESSVYADNHVEGQIHVLATVSYGDPN